MSRQRPQTVNINPNSLFLILEFRTTDDRTNFVSSKRFKAALGDIMGDASVVPGCKIRYKMSKHPEAETIVPGVSEYSEVSDE